MIWELGDRTLHFGDQVQIMGVLNATPDSFYDGGSLLRAEGSRWERGLEMVEEGAAIVDIGGESSRPPMYGVAEDISVAEECARVLPVVEGLRRQSDVPISVDTVKAEVAQRALEVGADIINDISALRHDPAMAEVAAQAKVPVVLMHRRGTATTMQQNTHYDDLLGTVYSFLQERVRVVQAQGVERVGRGSGLGVRQVAGGATSPCWGMLEHFLDLECPLVVGASRKSFIWKTLGLSAAESLEGSLAAAAASGQSGRPRSAGPRCGRDAASRPLSRGRAGPSAVLKDPVLFHLFGFLPVSLTSVVDILLVGFIFFRLFSLIKETRVAHMVVGLLLMVIVALAAPWLKMNALSWLLEQARSILLILLVILFQPELRRLLQVLGQTPAFRWFYKADSSRVIDEVVSGVGRLADLGYGALIVLVRQVPDQAGY